MDNTYVIASILGLLLVVIFIRAYLTIRLDKFISLIAAILGLTGSLFIASGILNLTPDIIAEQVTTYYGYNSSQLMSIAGQKANVECGVVFIIIAFIAQAINSFFVKEQILPFKSNIKNAVLVAATAIIIVLMFLVYFKVNPDLKRRYIFEATKTLAKADLIDSIKSNNMKIGKPQLNNIISEAKGYFDFRRLDQETGVDFLYRYAEFLDVNITNDVDISELND